MWDKGVRPILLRLDEQYFEVYNMRVNQMFSLRFNGFLVTPFARIGTDFVYFMYLFSFRI